MNNEDVFLLLASLTDFNVSKALIKKLYHSVENLFCILTYDFNDLKPKIIREEFEKINLVKSEVKKLKLDEIKRRLDRKGIRFLPYSDKQYPEKLRLIDDPPFGLFFKGNLDVLQNKRSVAIVGTRAATNYGITNSKDIASLLAKQEVAIISGLASGIDTSAHIGGVQSGKTIAVVGTGVDIIFPASNKELFHEILDKGNLIISEYPPGTEGLPWNFPQRNRIISALSDAVIVIEGDVQSGAMITARFAIKQSKPLFALPGPIDSPASNGPNILIKSGVAELLTSVNDVLEKIGLAKQMQLNLKSNDKTLDGLGEIEKIIYRLLSSQTKSFDSLIQETNLNVQELTKHLSILELKGIIEKMPDGGYSKV